MLNTTLGNKFFHSSISVDNYWPYFFLSAAKLRTSELFSFRNLNPHDPFPSLFFGAVFRSMVCGLRALLYYFIGCWSLFLRT